MSDAHPPTHDADEFELSLGRWDRLIVGKTRTQPCRPVLVVEDDDDVRSMLVETLSEAGFDAVGAANARDAYRIAESDPPQAILLDIGLPQVNGDVFVSGWRRASGMREVPVAVVSARPDARAVARRLGACAVLDKPVDVDAVASVVRRMTAPPASAPAPRAV